MGMNEALRLIAGTFVLASVALGYFVHPAWFLFTAFVGVNLVGVHTVLSDDVDPQAGRHPRVLKESVAGGTMRPWTTSPTILGGPTTRRWPRR